MKQSAISRIEQAEYSGWSFNTLLRVADALGARLRVTFEPAESVIERYEENEVVAVKTAQAPEEFHLFSGMVSMDKTSFPFSPSIDEEFKAHPVMATATN